MKYTKIPADTFKNLQLNAGVLLKSFDVDTQTLGADSIVGATSGGVSFTAVPSFIDFGEDIDNCPKNMKEMKKLDSWEAKMSGTFASVSKSLAKTLVGAADLAGSKITPRNDLAAADFSDLWWVGDYSEVNEDGASTGKAGFIAIHLLNSLSTGGFSIQSSDKGKGQFEFEFTGHYSMEDQDKVPFEVYVQEGTAA
nr:MAG TPA: major tail protein [Caudoviricetes sp.]